MLTLSCFSLLSMGCSFLFVRPPPSEPDTLPYFDCVSSSAAPVTDITNVALNSLVVASSLDQHEPGVAAGAGIAGAVYAASAIYGLVMTSRCEGAKERLAARVHATRVQLDGLLKVQTPGRSEPTAGCRRDYDCKGDRVCANAICVNPPAAPLRSAPPLTVPPLTAPPLSAPPSAPPPPAAPPPAPSSAIP